MIFWKTRLEYSRKRTSRNDANALRMSGCEAAGLTTRRYSLNRRGLGVLEVKGVCQWECAWLVWTWATSSVPTVLPWQLVRLRGFFFLKRSEARKNEEETHEMAKPFGSVWSFSCFIDTRWKKNTAVKQQNMANKNGSFTVVVLDRDHVQAPTHQMSHKHTSDLKNKADVTRVNFCSDIHF